MSNGCKQLTSLNISNCDNITDASVIALSKGCTQLTSLNLTGCKNITDASAIALTTTIPKKTRRPMVEKEDRSATSVMPAVPAIPAMSVQVVKTRLVDLTVIRRSILKIAVNHNEQR